MTVPPDTRVLIEQAIARGETLDWICDTLDVEANAVDETLDYLERVYRDEAPEPDVMPHGTHTAYNRHKRRSEKPCPECTAGEAEYWRQRNGAQARALSPCGTYAAYVRHRSRGETPDTACIDAQRVYAREAKQRQRERRAA